MVLQQNVADVKNFRTKSCDFCDLLPVFVCIPLTRYNAHLHRSLINEA